VNLSEQEQAVLDYYAREGRGFVETEPLAGLRLPAFRAARGRLVAKGQLVQSTAGRYSPIDAVSS
jgi:hypothetical protein